MQASDKTSDSWFDFATQQYGHVLGVEQLLSDNKGLWLSLTQFQGDYEVVVTPNVVYKTPNLS